MLHFHVYEEILVLLHKESRLRSGGQVKEHHISCKVRNGGWLERGTESSY